MLRCLKLDVLKEELAKWQASRRMVVVVVYLSLVLDNMLLTVVVPIIPDYLYHLEHPSNQEPFPGVLWPQGTHRAPLHSDLPVDELISDSSGVDHQQEALQNRKRHDVTDLKTVRKTQYVDLARPQNGSKRVMDLQQEPLQNWKQHDVTGLKTIRRRQYVDLVRPQDGTKGVGDFPLGIVEDPRSGTTMGEKDRDDSLPPSREKLRLLKWLSIFRSNQSSNNTVAKKSNKDPVYKSSSRPKKINLNQKNEERDSSQPETPKEDLEDDGQRSLTSSLRNKLPSDDSPLPETSSTTPPPEGTVPTEISPPKEVKERLHSHPISSSQTPEDIINENSRIGILFSSKAVVQLLVNPVVGPLTSRVGYGLPLFAGSIVLLGAAILFASAEGFALLFVARSLQGVASSCIAIAGMGVIAELHPDDQKRGCVLGFVLGGIALGVLAGYPFGGLLYDFTNSKATPFLALAVLIALLALLQLVLLHPWPTPCGSWANGTPLHELLQDPYVLVTAGSVMFSTSAIGVLEPCLPIWLMDTIRPETWQLGLAFIPDSMGYLIGTNFFADFAYRHGRWRVAMVATVLLAVSATLIPESTSMMALAVPHFGLGLGIGVVDSSLMPLLASVVDNRHVAAYGSVYAIAQTAVAFAYALGPIVGGTVVRSIGFPWLMRCVGVANLAYCPLLLLLARFTPDPEETQAIVLATPDPKSCLTQSTAHVQPLHLYYHNYQRLSEEED